ncbi:unnamed protein product, partial [Mesorhabditis spiculigera]
MSAEVSISGYSFQDEAWIFEFIQYFAIFGLFVNLFGLYVVSTHNPPALKSIGRLMTLYQAYQVALFIHVIALVLVLFLHRYFSILPRGHPAKLGPWGSTALFAFLQLLPYVQFGSVCTWIFLNTNLTENRIYAKELYPALSDIIDLDTFFMVKPPYSHIAVANILSWIIIVAIAATCIFEKRTMVMSQAVVVSVQANGKFGRYSLSPRVTITRSTSKEFHR